MTSGLLWEMAFVLYGAANLFFWAELAFQKKIFVILASWLAFIGMAIHLGALITRGIQANGFPVIQAHDALGLLAILILTSYFVVQWKWALRGFGFFATALAFLFTLVSLAYPGDAPRQINPELSGTMLDFHIAAIILSFGILALAFCSSVAYLAQDFMLHGKRMMQLSKRLPPLTTLDLLTNRLVGVGFILLSIGIALGSLWAEHQWGKWWSSDAKLTLALITWLTYAIYIYARTLSGWKGKRSVFLIIVGFVLILLTFVGTNFLPGRHRFIGQTQRHDLFLKS